MTKSSRGGRGGGSDGWFCDGGGWCDGGGRRFWFEGGDALFEAVELAEGGDVEDDEGEDDEEEDGREFLHERISGSGWCREYLDAEEVPGAAALFDAGEEAGAGGEVVRGVVVE